APCVGEVDPRVAATVGQLAGVHRAGIAVVAIHRPAGLADASLAACGPVTDVAATARRAVGNGRVDAGTAAVARVRRARAAVVAIDACMVAALNGVAGVDGAGIAVVAAAAPDRRARAVAATAAGNVVAIARAVVARTRATGTFLRAAARPAVVLPAHAV